MNPPDPHVALTRSLLAPGASGFRVHFVGDDEPQEEPERDPHRWDTILIIAWIAVIAVFVLSAVWCSP